MFVGLFMVTGFAALVYLALNLGEVRFVTQSSTYVIKAEFDNVSGVKEGASVQVAGVVVGSVSDIRLSKDDIAQLSLRIARDLKVPLDSIASVNLKESLAISIFRYHWEEISNLLKKTALSLTQNRLLI